MLLDKLFWLWFMVTGAALVAYMAANGLSYQSVFLSALLIGVGLLKLAEESGRSVRKGLLDKLR